MRNELINFDNCPYSIRNGMYGGVGGRKDGIIYNNEMWIIKYPKSTKDMIGDNLLSYTSSPVSEYLGSKVYEMLGFDVHKTLLGERNGYLVVACKDFCDSDERLLELKTILNYADVDLAKEVDSSDSPSSSFSKVDIDMVRLQLDKNPILNISGMKERFWDQAIVDAYINNNDRNYGNWGIIRDKNGNDRIAPVYDNGAAFNNKLTDSALKKQLEDKNFESRVVNVMSVYYKGDKRLYISKLLDYDDPILKKELCKVIPLIEQNHEKICEMIASMPERIKDYSVVSIEKKEHFIRGLDARFNKVLLPALEKAQKYNPERTWKDIKREVEDWDQTRKKSEEDPDATDNSDVTDEDFGYE